MSLCDYQKEVWDIAVHSRDNLAKNDIIALREQIIFTAKAYGYWDIWRTVFSGDEDMISRFTFIFDREENCK